MPSLATVDTDNDKWNLPITVQVASDHPFIKKTYNLTVIRNGIQLTSTATSGAWLRYSSLTTAFAAYPILYVESSTFDLSSSYSQSGGNTHIVAVNGASLTIRKMFNGNLFSLSNGATLTLGYPGMNGYIYINANKASYSGNTFNLSGSGTSLTMYANVYIRNSSGYAVELASGTSFIMHGGTIGGNGYGGNSTGVVVNSGATFTMNNGTISYNNAGNSSGGGVYNNGTFTMNNGSINNNSASNGGGLCNAGGTSTLNGGSINSNSATYGVNGGYYRAGGTVANNGTTVTGNSPSN
jgi:hypothetical protein